MALSTWVDVATLATVVIGVVFGVMQVRQAAIERRQGAALGIIQWGQSPEGNSAAALVRTLPDGFTVDDVKAAGKETEAALALVVSSWETIGWMVYKGLVPLHDLDGLTGGTVRATWKRLKPYAEDLRHRNNSNNPLEWMQWLAEQLERHPLIWKAEGAHRAFKDWTPPR